MTTTITKAPTPPSGQSGTRGRLTVEKRVVERVASQAAAESTADAGGSSGGVLGFGAQADLNARPDATVELVGRTATVSLDVTVAYPTSILAATDRIRAHVVERVTTLVGVEVTRVDITVTSLHRADTSVSRVQ